MHQNFDFFKTSMPNTRIADFYLGCLDGGIFIDFYLSKDKCIYLRRISFDGYGCCDLNEHSIPLNLEESYLFINTFKKDDLDQEIITDLITKIIDINKQFLWQDALKKYGLIN